MILTDSLPLYLSDPSVRAQPSPQQYHRIRPKHLKVVLDKLARWTPEPNRMTGMDAERMVRRRREGELVGAMQG